MARKVVTEQSKAKNKKRKIFITIGIILLIAAIVGGVIYFVKPKNSNNPVEVKVLDQNVDYGYSLSDRDGELYKKEYNELKKIIEAKEVDIEKYVTQVAKVFIIDLYSMETKLNMYDVGGSEYFHKSKKDMYDKKVMDTLYSTIEDDTYGDRKQTLPMVKTINVINTTETTYTMDGEKVDAYSVKLEWTLENGGGYDDKGTVVLVKEDDKRWSVVDYQPTFSPQYNTNKK